MYQAVRLPREAIIVLSIYNLNHLLDADKQAEVENQLQLLSGHLSGAVVTILDITESNGDLANVEIAITLLQAVGHMPIVVGSAAEVIGENVFMADDIEHAIDEARIFLAENTAA